jgi:hypothetical protein
MNNFLCEGVKGFETDCRKIRKEYRKRVLSMQVYVLLNGIIT